MTMEITNRVRRGAVVGVLVLGLAACGRATDDPDPGGMDGPTRTTGATVAVQEVRENVSYYGACGNEVLDLEGVTFYPLLPEEVDALDLERYPVTGGGASGEPTGVVLAAPAGLPLPAVPAPGPGDDVGTLTVFVDGIAHFASYSGDLESWLTQEPRTYTWEC